MDCGDGRADSREMGAGQIYIYIKLFLHLKKRIYILYIICGFGAVYIIQDKARRTSRILEGSNLRGGSRSFYWKQFSGFSFCIYFAGYE